jgi:conjugal transfer pilus assembly protein TraA
MVVLFFQRLNRERLFPMNNLQTQNAMDAKTVALLGFTAMTVATLATAGADTTFGTVATLVKGWTEGSLGDLVALGTLAVGLTMGVVKQTLMPVAVAAGIAVTANYGPTVLTGIAAATF